MLLQGVSHPEAKERAVAALTKIGLEARLKNLPKKLSGGRNNVWPSHERW